ncbi:MmgE/PrpD family protein [Variovorax sp. EBFNA2]|uniref:MmgE/PrpD family protein n=1 Tax=Variovorax sp. EBFNA2 TaxID=3342097 RepID=UPI0029C0DEB9|nr:MmgE/PrpD family protein [Variovorax boronicumulans]WPG41073.1 MmgE/PrpD family protein [Variovorax boronicumulans]
MSATSESIAAATTNEQTSLTSALVARARSIAQTPLRDDMRELARQCVLDWVGVTLAGSREPLVRLLRAQAREDGGNAVATLVGDGSSASVRQAALINGAAGHAIDYDDANVAAQGHVTAAVLPAALAIAEARGLGGDALLRAFAAGYEITGMVGQYVGRAHYELGFHGTSTMGSFGAAYAASTLMALDADATAVALGIAGTQAGGQKAQFGTMCKPFHAGKAAENGVVGAQLAARGFTGRADLLEAPQGFGAATTPTPDAKAAVATPAGGSHLHHNLFKYHSACYGTHAAIEAVSAIARQHGLTPSDIECIEIDVESGAQRMCDIRAPRTGLEAKFSIRLNAALAIAGEDTSAPATYSDATAQRADLIALRDRVSVRFMPAGWPYMLAEARVRTRDGRDLAMRYDSGIPDTDLRRQRMKLERKFMALTVPIVGIRHAQTILRALAEIEKIEDIGSLMSMLKQPSGTHS